MSVLLRHNFSLLFCFFGFWNWLFYGGGGIERPKHSFIFMTGHQLQPEELRWRAFVNVFWFLPSPVCALFLVSICFGCFERISFDVSCLVLVLCILHGLSVSLALSTVSSSCLLLSCSSGASSRAPLSLLPPLWMNWTGILSACLSHGTVPASQNHPLPLLVSFVFRALIFNTSLKLSISSFLNIVMMYLWLSWGTNVIICKA